MPNRIDLQTSPTSGDPISKKDLQHYVDRYKKERYKHIRKHITNDSRGAWISRSKLQEFLDMNPDSTGVRFYFGVIKDSNPGFEQGAHNLIFVPTVKNGLDNEDLLSDDDWVVVLENPSLEPWAGEPQGAICPPPKNPCGGNGLSYK